MTYQHHAMAAGRWSQLSFVEQMANIGSDVERALNWRAKQHAEYSQRAFERALELMELTLTSAQGAPRRREVARVREALIDYFVGGNLYGSTDASWRRYFLAFAYAARRNR
jgi:hypothetical protein